MTANIINGKTIAHKIRDQLKEKIVKLKSEKKTIPGLAMILVGNNSASQIYVQNKRKACQECGMLSQVYDLSNDTTEKTLLDLINQLNQDVNIHGILVQLPLPVHINTARILDQIDPKKDVDGFHPINLGLLAQGRPHLRPCTPYGVMRLLDYEKIEVKGLNAVVIGTSNIVGKPMALELINAGCTVTVCHSATRDLASPIRQADLVVSAIGKSGVIQSEWFKSQSIIIDVGIIRTPEGKVHGDIDFETAKPKAAYITPVPGGVGPMTVAMLLENTLLACKTLNY